jgi:hypothetical protein
MHNTEFSCAAASERRSYPSDSQRPYHASIVHFRRQLQRFVRFCRPDGVAGCKSFPPSHSLPSGGSSAPTLSLLCSSSCSDQARVRCGSCCIHSMPSRPAHFRIAARTSRPFYQRSLKAQKKGYLKTLPPRQGLSNSSS